MPGVCVHLYPSHIQNDSRSLRICGELAQSGLFDEVLFIGADRTESELQIAAGFRALHLVRPDTTQAGLLEKLRATKRWTRKVVEAISNLPVTCIGCHSLSLLPSSVKLARRHKAKLVYETHELETETAGAGGLRKKASKFTEDRFIRKADAVVVVNQSIADWYAATYPGLEPFVLRNIPSAISFERSNVVRDTLKIPEDELVFITQGRLGEGRGIPLLLEVFAGMPHDRHLVVMGSGPLESRVRDSAAKHGQIHFFPSVPPDQVLATTSGANVGISFIEPLSLSYEFALPNKFFEFLHAGLPIISNNIPEQRRIIDQFGCGLVVGDQEELSRLVRSISPDSISEKLTAVSEAKESNSWANEKDMIVDTYSRVMASRR